MLYTPDDVKPSQDKVRAIENFEQPKDKRELHTFLGMATYMSSFIPNLADHTTSLRNLLKENVVFAWNPSHSKAFEKVKSLTCIPQRPWRTMTELNQLSFTLTHQFRAYAQLCSKTTSQLAHITQCPNKRFCPSNLSFSVRLDGQRQCKDKAFIPHGLQNGRRVIKVNSFCIESTYPCGDQIRQY